MKEILVFLTTALTAFIAFFCTGKKKGKEEVIKEIEKENTKKAKKTKKKKNEIKKMDSSSLDLEYAKLLGKKSNR